jgi:hypothetical protein
MNRRITKNKKLLFLGVSFQHENAFTNRRLGNGYITYSINVIDELTKYFDVTVVTDKPNLLKNKLIKKINIFNKNPLDQHLLANWQSLFSFKLESKRIFQRDIIYHNISVINLLDAKKLEKLISDNTYAYIIFNRCDFLLTSLLFEKTKKILLTHDSQYLRKRSFSKSFKCNHALTDFDKIIEEHTLTSFSKIIAISPKEFNYFDSMYPQKVNLFRPLVSIPKCLVRINTKKTIKAYFLGSAHFSNTQLFLESLKIVEDLRKLNYNIEFFGIGSFINNLSKSDRNSKKYTLLGDVEDLSSVMPELDLQICPISSGSGAPTKISSGLSFGHFILTSKFGADVYEEFVSKRLFYESNPGVAIKKIAKISKEKKDDLDPYFNYNSKNHLQNL